MAPNTIHMAPNMVIHMAAIILLDASRIFRATAFQLNMAARIRLYITQGKIRFRLLLRTVPNQGTIFVPLLGTPKKTFCTVRWRVVGTVVQLPELVPVRIQCLSDTH